MPVSRRRHHPNGAVGPQKPEALIKSTADRRTREVGNFAPALLGNFDPAFTPSRLIGHHLRGRVYDDRIDLFLGASFLLTLPRARATRHGPHQHVVSYHHVIHSLRQKPMALMGLTYRDQLFPRQAFRDLFDMLLVQTSDKQACRLLVDFLALAHDRGCETEIAAQIEDDMRHKQIPDIAALRARFAPCVEGLPKVEVRLGALAAYNNLLSAPTMMQEAAA